MRHFLHSVLCMISFDITNLLALTLEGPAVGGLIMTATLPLSLMGMAYIPDDSGVILAFNKLSWAMMVSLVSCAVCAFFLTSCFSYAIFSHSWCAASLHLHLPLMFWHTSAADFHAFTCSLACFSFSPRPTFSSSLTPTSAACLKQTGLHA